MSNCGWSGLSDFGGRPALSPYSGTKHAAEHMLRCAPHIALFECKISGVLRQTTRDPDFLRSGFILRALFI